MNDTPTSPPGTDQQVHDQYERYPYPNRAPQDETRRLITGSPSQLLEINHYLFAGRRDFSQPFRALIAGGGTGDACIMLAQQLADAGCPGEVVYLDLSSASRAITEARAKVRGLSNIRFHTGALEQVSALCPGPYDYIDCCGVLHHLADPDAGIQALTAELAEEGGFGIMLYGTLGRTGVYHLQQALGLLVDNLPDDVRLQATRALLADLPESNWLRRNPFVTDHRLGGNSELYDLLLHRRDRPYTVPEIGALLGGAGLAVTSFITPLQYDPDAYLNDAALRQRSAQLSAPDRAALAEVISGARSQHVFYATRHRRAADAVASPQQTDLVPVYPEQDPVRIANGLKPNDTITTNLGGFQHRALLPALAPAIAKRIDGKRSIAEIIQDLATDPAITASRSEIEAQYQAFHQVMGAINWLLLRSR
jgi:SAM-dependent methyltransferase